MAEAAIRRVAGPAINDQRCASVPDRRYVNAKRARTIMKPQGFPKSARLLKSDEFDRVFRRRCAASDDHIVLHAAIGTTDEARLGLVVSRKCGNAAARNRWKRCLREAFRLVRSELPACDFVVVPRAGSIPAVSKLQDSFRTLAVRLVDRLRSASKEPT